LNEGLRCCGGDSGSVGSGGGCKGGGGGDSVGPWDIVDVAGVGQPNPQTGKYASYTAKVWPGTVNGLIAGNMFDVLTISGTSIIRFKAVVTTDGSAVTGVTMVANETPAAVQTPTPFGLPSKIELEFGVVYEGKAYRTIGNGSIVLSGKLQFTTDKSGAIAVGETPLIEYYAWVASII